MLNAVGHVIKDSVGRYKGTLRTVSIKADIDMLPNILKTSDSQPDFHVMTEANEISVVWMQEGEAANKGYANLSIAAPEFGPKIYYAIFDKAAGSDDTDLYAVFWNPADQTIAPAQDLHGGNHL